MNKNLIKSFLSSCYRKTSIYFFGNIAGIKVNLLFASYIFIIKLIRLLSFSRLEKYSAENDLAAKSVRRNGFYVIKPFKLEPEMTLLAEKLDKLFQNQSKIIRTLEEGGLIRLKSCLIELPELSEFIFNDKVSGILGRYFGCGFKIYSCDVYRTVPNHSNNPEEKFQSLKWHFDNMPSALLKVMVYLKATTKHNGALTIVDKVSSERLKNEGFWDRNYASSFLSRIEDKAQTIEGGAGSTLIFSTHYCLHKATLPESDYRDVAVFLLYPTLKVQEQLSRGQKEDASYSYGYCINPFKGTPQRYGDE